MSLPELPPNKRSQSQQKRKELTKYEKLAQIKSIDKFVKNNDITSVIGHDNDYYPKQLEDQKKIDEVDEVHSNLTGLKKSCDELKRKTEMRDKEIEQMRKEIDQMTQLEEGFYQFQEAQINKQTQLRRDYEVTKIREQETANIQKTYYHMLSRMKKDSVVYQKKLHQYERQLKSSNSSLSNKIYQYQKIHDDEQKTKNALEEIMVGKKEQMDNRERNLQRFQEDLQMKQDLEQKREDRLKRQQEIAEVAANDLKEGNLKKWRKLLLVHKFLNQFLKSKMQSEISKFAGVEQAFQKIKASTGVTDANEIVKKFLGREQTYSHLLVSIAQYEKEIDEYKLKNEELKSYLEKLQAEFDIADREMSTTERIDDLDQDKKLQEIEEKALNSELLDTKLLEWIEKNSEKLQRSGLIEEVQNKDAQDGFNKIVNVLRSNLLQLNENDLLQEQTSIIDMQIKSQIEDLNEPEFVKRNTRVKAISKRSFGNTNQSYERSFSQQDDLGTEQQDQDIVEEEIDQESQYFQELRDTIKQNGESYRKKK